jgi:chloride channel, nucleotide-sensitive, 1A
MSVTGKGFHIPYPAITLHAVSRAQEGPCIYCQIDESGPEQNGEEDTDSEMREMSLVPQTEDACWCTSLLQIKFLQSSFHAVEPIFEALSLCASLHPDPALDGMMDEEDDDDAVISGDFEVFTGDEGAELSEVGRVRSDFASDTRFKPY